MQLGGSEVVSMGMMERDVNAENEEYGAREMDDLERLEECAVAKVENVYQDSKSFMREKRQKWVRYWDRYRARYGDPNDNSPLAKLNVSKLSKINDLFKSRLKQLTIPDKQRLDFIDLTPDPVSFASFDEAMLTQYAELATINVREDLRQCNFVNLYDMMLLDLLVTGNMVAMPYYDFRLQSKYRRVPNPEYNPMLPPEENVYYDESGLPVPIDPEIVERIPVREADRPAVRYLNPLNVYPSEPDQHNYEECQAVIIFDKVLLDDLRGDEINPGDPENSGYLYANLEKLEKSDGSLTPQVDSIDTSTESSRFDKRTLHRANNEASRGLGRKTYIGRWSLEDLFKVKEGEVEYDASPEQIEQLIEKFGIDRDKLENWNTWVVEVIDGVLVRMQPIPFFSDRKNIRHMSLYATPNNTVGEGNYDRAEAHETIFNCFLKYGIEATLRMVKPMWGVVRQYVDPRYWQESGGKLSYAPDKLVPLTPAAANINQVLSQLQTNPQALQLVGEQMADQERTMSEMTHHPAVKQGLASGGNTATEVSAMNQNSDVMLDEIAQAVEMQFLAPLIGDLLELHHQYSDHAKVVNDFDKAGDLSVFQIPPEVWLRRYHVNLMGYRQTGNQAVQAQIFEKFYALAERTGRVNHDEALPEYGRRIGVKFPDRFLAPPPPPPGPDMKGSLSLTLKGELLPPEVLAEALGAMGVQVSPAALAQMGVLIDNAQMAMALQATGGDNPSPGGGGGGSEANRNHHAPGEYTPSRGLGDEAGIEKSMGQMMRDPNNSRAANAI
jgi:hypothetical protein